MTSKRVQIAKKTLGDRVIKNFSKVKLKRISVRVPRLNVKNANAAKSKSGDRIPVSSIINILIKSAVEKAKKERKETAVEDKSYKLVKEELSSTGGYGSVSKSYGISPHSTYADYKKLFSYLGKFRARSSYSEIDESTEILSKPESSFILIDKETVDKGTKYIRYFRSSIPVDKTSLVPLTAGMSSAEWEEFKLFMRFDTVMYLLKISTS